MSGRDRVLTSGRSAVRVAFPTVELSEVFAVVDRQVLQEVTHRHCEIVFVFVLVMKVEKHFFLKCQFSEAKLKCAACDRKAQISEKCNSKILFAL